VDLGKAKDRPSFRVNLYQGIIVSRAISIVASSDHKCRTGKLLAHIAEPYTYKKAILLSNLLCVFLHRMYARIHSLI
jgi:hypothetical protein